jgi:hypothetical protein
LFDPVAVIVEPAEGNHLGERFEAANMVSMPVADHDVFDPRQARFLSGCEDSLRIAVAVAGIAGVEQQRVPSGRDEQRRRSSFDVDPVDLQVAPGLRGGRVLTLQWSRGGQRESSQDSHRQNTRHWSLLC